MDMRQIHQGHHKNLINIQRKMTRSMIAKRRLIWGIVLMGLAVLVVWDITSTVAQKRIINPILIDPLSKQAPKQNSIVGICNSMDPALGDMQAPLDAVLTYAQVDSITRLAVQRSGGLEDLIEEGDWVCIKFNMVARHNAAAATDLRMVKSLVEQLIEEGDAGTISVVEGGAWCRNPGHDGWSDHYPDYDNLSYEDMVTDLDTLNPQVNINFIDLNYPPYTPDVPVPGGGLSQDSYTIPDAILHCDKLISAAVQKTHYFAGVTLCHKNYVGIAPADIYTSGGGCNKMLVPHDRIERSIVDLFSYHPADFAITECNIGMEGLGPTGGSPIRRNVIVASRDAVSADAISSYLMGFNPWDIDHLHWSNNKGYGIYDLDYITVLGPDVDSIRHDFQKAPHYDVRGPPWRLDYYQGRACRTWLINGKHSGTDINQDYLGSPGGEGAVAPVEGDTTAGLVWTLFIDVDDYTDLLKHFDYDATNCIAYAYTRVIADTAQTAYLRFGSDDGIKIWLNGDSIYSNPETGGWSIVENADPPSNNGLPITLQQGVNRLLVKIKNTIGDYGFSMFVSESDGDTPLGVKYSIQCQVPPVPALISPRDSAVIADTTPTFVWSSTALVGGSYTLQHALDSNFTEGVVTESFLVDTSYTVPDGQALPDTSYYWHVQAFNAEGESSGYQADPFIFIVDTDIPDVPMLLTPVDSSYTNDSTPTFSWSQVTKGSGLSLVRGRIFKVGGKGDKATAVTYTLQCATDGGFSDIVIDTAGLTGTSYTVPDADALADTTYCWRVEAVDQAENHSGYGSPFIFTADTKPPSKVLNLEASSADTSVILTWSPATDNFGVYHYVIYRDTVTFTPTPENSIGITKDTAYIDRAVVFGGTYYYRASAVDYAENEGEYSDEVEGVVGGVNNRDVFGLPKEYSLFQNYPNPFNPITQIKYALPRDCQVRLEIYNILGQRVATLVDGRQTAGCKSVRWDGSPLSSGIYFYRLRAGEFSQINRMVLLR